MAVPVVVVAIAWGVAAIATTSGIYLVVQKMARMLANRKLAILGAQRVGKSTLFRMFRDGKVPKRSLETVDAEPGTTFVLRISKKDIRVEIPRDVEGSDGAGFPEWRKAFNDADFVLYLFRADHLVSDNEKAVALVKNHISLLKGWLSEHSGSAPRIVLVGTFADQWPGVSGKRGELFQLVESHPVVKAGMVKLNNAGLVVGSLENTRSAGSLIKGIVGKLA